MGHDENGGIGVLVQHDSYHQAVHEGLLEGQA